MIQDKDYIMRLVHEIARMLIRMIFNRDIDREGESSRAMADRSAGGAIRAYMAMKYVVDCYGYGDLWDPVSR